MTIVGLDLHKRYITACAMDSSGSLLGEVRGMPVALEVLSNFMSDFPAPASVGMEATLCWTDRSSQVALATPVHTEELIHG